MELIGFGIYHRSDGIPLAYAMYQLKDWYTQLYCAMCPPDIVAKYDPSKVSHRRRLIQIARHRGGKGGYKMCHTPEEAYIQLELCDPLDKWFWP